MGFNDTWIDFIHRTATGTRRFRNLLTPVGVICFGGFTTLFVFLALLADAWLELPRLLPLKWGLVLGLLLAAGGSALSAWSVFHFLRVKGTPVPINPPPVLVTSGPYAFTRNPMLSGLFILLFGIGFVLGSWSLTLIFVPLFIALNRWELKTIEEPELLRRLGAPYRTYRHSVPMFIPRLGRKPIYRKS